jgi:ParB family chromosome partitioning protein
VPAELPTQGLQSINVYQVDSNPFQPRQDFDEEEVKTLAESIKQHGLLQPIAVRRVNDRFELIAGERRLRAAIRAGWSEVPAQILDVDSRQSAELAIVENLQRKDLNPLEKAASFQRYLEEYGCKHEDLAARLNIDRSTVANLIRLLELPATVQEALRAGILTQGHARALLPLGDEREQVAFTRRIVEEGLSVRDTEQLIQQLIIVSDVEPLSFSSKDSGPETRRRATSQHLESIQQDLRRALGTKTDVRQTARGRGRIVIHFKNHGEFERLLELLTSTGSKPASQAG